MIGVDEVGRGCWAGPLLVVAAKASSALPTGLKDSKLLSKKQRLELLNKLSNCCKFGEGWVESNEIDQLGLANALKLGVQRALANIGAEPYEEIVMDGTTNYTPVKYKNSKTLVRADTLLPIVSAASIYAKVRRDAYMTILAASHPLYGFEKHVGYGTKQHITALGNYGVIDQVHRQSFAPVAKLVT